MIQILGILAALVSQSALAGAVHSLGGTYVSSQCKEYNGLIPNPEARLMQLDAWNNKEFAITASDDKVVLKAVKAIDYFDSTFDAVDDGARYSETQGPWETDIKSRTIVTSDDRGLFKVVNIETTGTDAMPILYLEHETTRLAAFGNTVLYVISKHTHSKTPDFTQDYFETRSCVLTRK